MEKNKIIGFCLECGQPITHTHMDDDGTNLTELYVCDSCGAELTNLIKADYEVGEKVRWIDPVQEPTESDEEYEERCKEVRTVTGILYLDGDCPDDIVYELDYGTEVYGGELIPIHCFITKINQ